VFVVVSAAATNARNEIITVIAARRDSGGGPPHSKTLARCAVCPFRAKRFGLRQPSGAFEF
jgi:hypothetical protein